MLAMCSASWLQDEFDWLSKSCDISACDLNPQRNPEKYGSPMKLAIKIRSQGFTLPERIMSAVWDKFCDFSGK